MLAKVPEKRRVHLESCPGLKHSQTVTSQPAIQSLALSPQCTPVELPYLQGAGRQKLEANVIERQGGDSAYAKPIYRFEDGDRYVERFLVSSLYSIVSLQTTP